MLEAIQPMGQDLKLNSIWSGQCQVEKHKQNGRGAWQPTSIHRSEVF